jgi:Protein of unknown function (DUF559)
MRSMVEGALRALVRTFARAGALRHRMSLPEVVLWQALRQRRLAGLRVRHQHPIGPYILDFYCVPPRGWRSRSTDLRTTPQPAHAAMPFARCGSRSAASECCRSARSTYCRARARKGFCSTSNARPDLPPPPPAGVARHLPGAAGEEPDAVDSGCPSAPRHPPRCGQD